MMMKAYASFADWKQDQTAKNKKLITALTTLIQKAAPQFSTMVKWGQGCWTLADKFNSYKIFLNWLENVQWHISAWFVASSYNIFSKKFLR